MMGKHKSRRSNGYCGVTEENRAKGCRRRTNVATMRDGLCIPCWQRANAKFLNKKRGVSVPKKLERKLLKLPISEWDEFLPRF